MLNKLVFVALIVFCISGNAQTIKEPKNSLELIGKGYSQVVNENFEEALSTFYEVSRNDTNYALAQINVIILHFSRKDYDKAEAVSRKMLAEATDKRTFFHKKLIESLLKQDKFQEAKEAALAAQKEYPLYHHFKVLEAECIYKAGETKKAEEMLFDLLKKNVFSAQGHYLLGQIAAENGRMVRAIISLHFAILSDNGMDNLSECYTLLENICSNQYAPKSKISEADKKLYNEIFELVESGVAKKQAYKSDLGVFYSLSNQIDLIIKSVEYQENTNDFWMEFYVPFLLQVKKKNQIAPYTLGFLQVNQSDIVKNLVTKYDKQIDQVIDDAIEFYTSKNSKIHYPVNGKTYDMPYQYGNGNNLYAVGEFNADDKRTGKWITFNLKGGVSGELNYADGDFDGKNVWYDEHGNINQIIHYNKGKIEGDILVPNDETGIISYKAVYKDEKLNGPVTNYYYNGLVKEHLSFKNGERHGDYYSLNFAGDTIGKGKYENGELEGPYLEFYPDGTLQTEMAFKKGNRDGEFKVYYQNGQIMKKGNYKDGKEVGRWEFYHDNGQIESFYTLTEKGKSDGRFYEFYANGDTSRTGYLKKGQLDGLNTEFTEEGKLFRKTIYKGGAIKSYQFFDSLGNVVSEGKKVYKGFDKYGYFFVEGALKGSKGKNGLWKYYYRNGIVSKEINFVKDVAQGTCKEYYYSGQLKSEYNYKDGMIDGYVINYHNNGEIESEGWFKEDERIGDWREYDDKGTLKEEYYYLFGSIDHYYMEYANDGKLVAQTYKENGVTYEISMCDTAGNIIMVNKFPLGNGIYQTVSLTPNTPYAEGELKGGLRHGSFSFLFPNGKPEMTYKYRYGTLDGPYIEYYFDGSIYEKGVYLNGEKEGVWERFYRDGTLRSKFFYHNGRLTGKFYHYHPNGKIKEISSVDANADEHGMDSIFWDNGTLARAVPMQNGDIHGSYEVYDVFGEVMYKKFYNGDEFYAYSYLKNGEWVDPIKVGRETFVQSFYNNGKKAYEYNMKNGQRHGSSKAYYSNGQLWEIENYVNGELEGDYILYHSNGKISLKCSYKNGHLVGLYQSYNEKGILVEEFNFDHGYKHGTSKYFSDKGKLEYTLLYHQGNELKITKAK